ncbi:MAG: hypothetical protein [Caudoviricetes sp.]|nr:MAG: hypothetical protein [Caudoviricetes sp.]
MKKIKETIALVDIDDETGNITDILGIDDTDIGDDSIELIDIDSLQTQFGNNDDDISIDDTNSLEKSLNDFSSIMTPSVEITMDEESEEPVQDGDNDGKGYKYDADIYNMFGDENQQMKYVPARFSDNPLKDPVVENRNLFYYLDRLDEKK